MNIVMQWMIGSSVTALVIIVLRYLLQRRVKATWIYGLWMILIIRLICPYLPTSQLSLLHAVKPGDVTTTHTVETIQDVVQEELSIESPMYKFIQDQPIQEVVEPSMQAISAKEMIQSLSILNTPATYVSAIDIKQVGKVIWAMGIISIIFYFAYVDRRFRGESRTLDSIYDNQTIGLIERYNKQLDIRRKIEVKWGNTPMSYGIFKPVIILPIGYEKQELEGILVHEMMHHKYGDMLINFLQVIILSVHWFNPLVWFAIYLMKQDAELACDERVLKQLKNKQIYAKVLLQVSDQSHSHYLAGSYMSFGKKQLKRRIVAMSKIKKQGFIWGSLIIVCGIVVGVVCLTNPGKKEEPVNSASIMEKEQPTEAKTIWEQINKIEFTNPVQHIEVSSSGKYAYIFDDEPSATGSRKRDKIYILTDEGKISEDLLDLTRKTLSEQYTKIEANIDYDVINQTYGWTNREGKEVFELITEATGGDGWDNYTAKITTVTVVVDPGNLENIDMEFDTQTYGKEFRLTEKEQKLYDDYISTKDVQVLKDISPIEAAKIIANCYKEGTKEEVYDLLIIPQSKEAFMLNATSMAMDKSSMNRKDQRMNSYYGLLDDAVVTAYYDGGTVDLDYKEIINDRVKNSKITLKKIDNVWRMLHY